MACLKTSAGVWWVNRLRGRSVGRFAAFLSSSFVIMRKLMPLGQYCRSRPPSFSSLPRCQGGCGLQQYAPILRSQSVLPGSDACGIWRAPAGCLVFDAANFPGIPPCPLTCSQPDRAVFWQWESYPYGGICYQAENGGRRGVADKKTPGASGAGREGREKSAACPIFFHSRR